MSKLSSGTAAPAFTLLDQSGTKVSLADFSGRKVLVFFYPKADTPGCTTQACGLRDVADEIGDTAVIGISPDLARRSSERFDSKHDLGFTLLSDPEHEVAEAYGVWGEKKLYGKVYMGVVRSSFLIAEDGPIDTAWYKISPKDTPKKLLPRSGSEGPDRQNGSCRRSSAALSRVRTLRRPWTAPTGGQRRPRRSPAR